MSTTAPGLSIQAEAVTVPARPPRTLLVLQIPDLRNFQWDHSDATAWAGQVKDATKALVHETINSLQAAVDLYTSVGQTIDKPCENLRFGIIDIWTTWRGFAAATEIIG